MANEILRIVIDRDCPKCGWPELIAEGTKAPTRVFCRKCDFSSEVTNGTYT